MGIVAGLVSPTSSGHLRAPSRGSLSLALPGALDAERLGLAPDTWLYRSTPVKFLTERGELRPNPSSVAEVQLECGARVNASSLPHPGLNVSRVPSLYHRWQSDTVMVRMRVGELIERGCRLYADTGSSQSGNVYVVVPSGKPLPVQAFSNQVRALLERVQDTYQSKTPSADALLDTRRLEQELSCHAVEGSLKGILPRQIRGVPVIEGNNPVWGGVFETNEALIKVPERFGETVLMQGCLERITKQFGFSARPVSGVFECCVRYAEERLPGEVRLPGGVFRKPLCDLVDLVDKGMGNAATRALLCAAFLEMFSREGEFRHELRLDRQEKGDVKVSLRSRDEDGLAHIFGAENTPLLQCKGSTNN